MFRIDDFKVKASDIMNKEFVVVSMDAFRLMNMSDRRDISGGIIHIDHMLFGLGCRNKRDFLQHLKDDDCLLVKSKKKWTYTYSSYLAELKRLNP